MKSEQGETTVQYDQARRVIDAIRKWWDVRSRLEDHSLDKAMDAIQFWIEAEHSLRGGLLGRIVLDGKDPLPHAPPKFYSRPWYALIEGGEGSVGVDELYTFPPNEPFEIGATIVVGQDAGWTVIQAEAPDSFVIEYRKPRWQVRATRKTADPLVMNVDYWDLELLGLAS